MFWRIGVHAVCCATSALLAMFHVPFFWTGMNQTFWSAGIGHVLTERPVAAVHHRMMGAIREYNIREKQMGLLEGQLRQSPDSPDRAMWQSELDRLQAERNRFYAKWFGIFAACYIPVGLFFEGFRRWGPNIDMEGKPFAPY